MAPEQLRGRPADARSDVFAFGALLYEMLSGRRAFPGESVIDRGYATVAADPPSFRSLSEPAQQAFCDGVTGDLVARLARVRALGVISRTPMDRYRTGDRKLSAIAAEVGADRIVEGSVLRVGARVRVNVTLLDASDRALWSSSYEREAGDELALQAA